MSSANIIELSRLSRGNQHERLLKMIQIQRIRYQSYQRKSQQIPSHRQTMASKPTLSWRAAPSYKHPSGVRMLTRLIFYRLTRLIGYSLSFGVFQEYYTTSPSSPFLAASPGSIATVGTTLNGFMYLMMPPSFTLLTRSPRLRHYPGPLGLFITAASLILSSFATQI